MILDRKSSQREKPLFYSLWDNNLQTCGVHDFARRNECEWLIMEIMIQSANIKGWMLVWDFTLTDRVGELVCRVDDDDKPVYGAKIPTDYTGGALHLWVIKNLDGPTVIMFPKEY